ncbi:MAG TPA: SDR family oxidoreductase [Chitinophagaceae bacterium]|nr:SDR family oxidoreductase [Chitinophagaceae bacterium]
MKILITGANGFLGHYLTGLLLSQEQWIIATGKGQCRLPFHDHSHFVYEEMDFTDLRSVRNVLLKHQPDCIVHAGAMSKPDECELNQELAYRVNVSGTENLLSVSSALNAFFVFISTDFVFDGKEDSYREEDTPDPVNYYGYTKMLAEQFVTQYKPLWATVRTVLVYGKPQTGKQNLLTVVKDKLEKGEPYNVFTDQVRTPTYVEDLAQGVSAIINKKATGLFHLSGEDVLTPFQMATEVADCLGLNKSLLHPVTSAEFAQPAKRPGRTVLELEKAKKELDYRPLSFKEGLLKTLAD